MVGKSDRFVKQFLLSLSHYNHPHIITPSRSLSTTSSDAAGDVFYRYSTNWSALSEEFWSRFTVCYKHYRPSHKQQCQPSTTGDTAGGQWSFRFTVNAIGSKYEVKGQRSRSLRTKMWKLFSVNVKCQCQMWNYIAHSRKKTSNAQNTLFVLCK